MAAENGTSVFNAFSHCFQHHANSEYVCIHFCLSIGSLARSFVDLILISLLSFSLAFVCF